MAAIACTRADRRHRLSRLVFPNFRLRNSPRFLANSQRPDSPAAMRPIAGSRPAKCFPSAWKKFHRLAGKIFSKRLKCRCEEAATGLPCTIGHARCLSKPPAGRSTRCEGTGESLDPWVANVQSDSGKSAMRNFHDASERHMCRITPYTVFARSMEIRDVCGNSLNERETIGSLAFVTHE